MNGYEPRFDFDFERGRVGENLVGSFLQALEGSRIEVKTDYRVTETGNVYVETWQYRLAGAIDKKPSGINTTEADYWVFASPSGQGFICIETDALKQIIRELDPPEVRQPISNETSNASIGRIIPIRCIMDKLQLRKGETNATN
jgi:hypothetical protein